MTPDDSIALLVYGTLKRGGRLHHHMQAASFLGEARTVPGFTLYRVSWYPAMVPAPGAAGVTGEVYRITPDLLRRLDTVEGYPDLYRREVVAMVSGPVSEAVCYLFNGSTAGLEWGGCTWDTSR